jgi:hypothetical protein
MSADVCVEVLFDFDFGAGGDKSFLVFFGFDW